MKRQKKKAGDPHPGTTHGAHERNHKPEENISQSSATGKRNNRIRQIFYRTLAGACDFLAEWQADDAEAKRTQVFQLISWRERLLIRGGLR